MKHFHPIIIQMILLLRSNLLTFLSHLDVIPGSEFDVTLKPLTLYFIVRHHAGERCTLFLHHFQILQLLNDLNVTGCTRDQ